MALTITLQGMGAFGATVGQPAYSFTAQLATPGPKGDKGTDGATGPQGPAGTSGVAYATAPLYYDSGTKTVSISTTPTFSTVEATSLKANNGSQLLQIFGDHIYFPDDTSQTTAGLSPAAAASTYLTITSASATYQTQAAMSAYLTTSSAASTYYPLTNPSGYITSSALTGYATETFVTSQGYITSSALSPYLTSATAASTYQTQSGMSAYLTTSAASSTYLTQTNASSTYLTQTSAASTYQTQAGMSSYLTTATAASTYFPIPTGTTAQYLRGNGTTSTFSTDVIAAVPSASTSTAGKVQLATLAQATTGTSSTLAISPDDLAEVMGHANFSRYLNMTLDSATSGTGGTNDSFGGGFGRRTYGPTSSGVGYVRTGMAPIPPRGSSQTASIDFSRRVIVNARIIKGTASSNSIFRLILGEPQASNTGDPSVRSIGIKITGDGAVNILAHDGTTLTTYATSFTFNTTASGLVDIRLVSNGSGSVEFFANGTSYGSTTGGPTSLSGTNNNYLNARVENLSGFTASPQQVITFGMAVFVAI